jgi:predicted house-cleaning NTP pyrophosphatase (Maf/HAM1 superfamily)
MQLVLASQSPYRKAQLNSFGLKFLTDTPLINEDELKLAGPKDPVELSRFLAEKKAESLKNKHQKAVLIGGS